MTTSAGDSRRVLVVDDNADAAELLVDLLLSWGHRAIHVFDGGGALTAAAEFLPEVVLLDIGLPGLDGYEVARRLVQLPALRDTRLVAMTGHCTDDDRERARGAGFGDHIAKPFDLEKLARVLRS